jgi:hypothetical protein
MRSHQSVINGPPGGPYTGAHADRGGRGLFVATMMMPFQMTMIHDYPAGGDARVRQPRGGTSFVTAGLKE